MKTKYLLLVLTFLFSILLFTGCLDVRDKFSDTRNKIIAHFGEGYKPEMSFAIGAGGIVVSSWIVGLAADEEYIDNMMREITGVQIQVYEKISDAGIPGYSVLNDLEENMNSSGWKSIVRSSDNGDLTAVYLSTNKDDYLKKLFIISCDDEELVLLEVEGNLTDVISTAIREKGLDLNL